MNAKLIEVALQQLVSKRATTKKPRLLEWQFRLYSHVLDAEDPEVAAEIYFRKTQFGRAPTQGMRATRLKQAAVALGFLEPYPGER